MIKKAAVIISDAYRRYKGMAVIRLDKDAVAAILAQWAWDNGGDTMKNGYRPRLNWDEASPDGTEGAWKIEFFHKPDER
jgi:hypothetical protein